MQNPFPTYYLLLTTYHLTCATSPNPVESPWK